MTGVQTCALPICFPVTIDLFKAVGHEKATVMFSDFSDFTSVAATYSPAELVEELNRAFCLFDGLSARLGVEKLKTIGDGYLCFPLYGQ